MYYEYELEVSKFEDMKAKLGTGKRFAAGKKKLMGKGMSAAYAAAVMAKAGRKKYGAKKMAAMAAKGRKKK